MKKPRGRGFPECPYPGCGNDEVPPVYGKWRQPRKTVLLCGVCRGTLGRPAVA